MSETIRQCWAYSADGARCEHPAGHPGNHLISKEWADDECFSPIKHQLPKSQPGLPVTDTSVAASPTEPAPMGKCAACSHNHKSGPCKCGCYEHIG
jgi:hypothetical protein